MTAPGRQWKLGTLVAALGSAPLRLTLDTSVEGAALLSSAEIAAELELPDLDHMRVERLDVATLGGSVSTRGDV